MPKFYVTVLKSDSQAVFEHKIEEDARSAYHSELASDYVLFKEGTIDSFTVVLMNQSGDVIDKEFKFRQIEG